MSNYLAHQENIASLFSMHSNLNFSAKKFGFFQLVLETVEHDALLIRGKRVAVGASGGKDSSVLSYVLAELNRKHDLGLELVLVSIDEGIQVHFFCTILNILSAFYFSHNCSAQIATIFARKWQSV